MPKLSGQRIWLVGNPTAGRGRGEVVALEIFRSLREAGAQVEMTMQHPSRGAPSSRPHAVVAVGGDGTIRGVVERLWKLYGGELPGVAAVPMGTANLLGQALGVGAQGAGMLAEMTLRQAGGAVERLKWRLPRWAEGLAASLKRASRPPRRSAAVEATLEALLPEPQKQAELWARRVVAWLRRGRISEVDICEADGQVFLLMAGVGFDAHVVEALDKRRQGRPIGIFSYAMPAAQAVARFDFPPLRVYVEGERVFGPKPGAVMVANVPQYGTGFPLVPEALPDDGLLDVLCLPCDSRAEVARLFALAADGQHLQTPGAVLVRGREARVVSEAPVPYQLDGDRGGRLPVTCRITGVKARFIGPAARS